MVILDHGEMFLRCVIPHNRTALTAFSAYYAHWISYFDSPVFTIVDRGCNLSATEIKNELHEIQS